MLVLLEMDDNYRCKILNTDLDFIFTDSHVNFITSDITRYNGRNCIIPLGSTIYYSGNLCYCVETDQFFLSSHTEELPRKRFTIIKGSNDFDKFTDTCLSVLKYKMITRFSQKEVAKLNLLGYSQIKEFIEGLGNCDWSDNKTKKVRKDGVVLARKVINFYVDINIEDCSKYINLLRPDDKNIEYIINNLLGSWEIDIKVSNKLAKKLMMGGI